MQKLFNISVEMKKAGLPDLFIANAVQVAQEYEGVADLMHLWSEEEDEKERNTIADDIQKMIDACLKLP